MLRSIVLLLSVSAVHGFSPVGHSQTPARLSLVLQMTKSNPENHFSDEDLISMTKEYLDNPSPDYWSEDYVFRGPVIGPLSKNEFVNTAQAVLPSDSFDPFEANAFGFSVDPVEANRVWWMVCIYCTKLLFF